MERFGGELDKELRYNIKTVEVEETAVDEKGKERTVKRTVKVTNPHEYSEFAVCYDVGCNGWDRDAEHNKWVLLQLQKWANDKLQHDGFLFLNDIYDELGIRRTSAGNKVGWIYDPKNPNHKGDNYVDFGIFDISRETNRDFVNGYEQSIWLDFNVDGPIIDLI